MPTSYSGVRNILCAAFSYQTGLDPVSAKALYERALLADERLRQEVTQALADASVDWQEMLYNNEYEVYQAIDAADAYRYAKTVLSSDLLR